jgi:Ca2+-binding RTX toxin-like protein
MTMLPSQAAPLDVVVGSSDSDTVPLATLVGSASTGTPTFVYGLAGNDSINGTGMTGKLWIDGGAGADTMTGGSGPNSFLYGAASESTASVMDIIGGFHSATDTIDLRGLGGHTLSFAGKFSGTKLATYSVGYQVSGGNTFVYVNTGGTSEALTATNMKVELLGSVSLTGSNILHV